METRERVRTYKVDYECKKCQVGNMRPLQMLMTDPPQWIHECTECKEQKTFNLKYPYIDYEIDYE